MQHLNMHTLARYLNFSCKKQSSYLRCAVTLSTSISEVKRSINKTFMWVTFVNHASAGSETGNIDLGVGKRILKDIISDIVPAFDLQQLNKRTVRPNPTYNSLPTSL